MELLSQKAAQLVRDILFVERAIHAPQPLVALAGADVKRQMARAQPRMPVLLDVDRRSARPSSQIHVQLLTRSLETRGVQPPNRRRFRRGVHQIVEAIDQTPNSRIAA